MPLGEEAKPTAPSRKCSAASRAIVSGSTTTAGNWPISCPHRGSTGIAITASLRPITSSGPPSLRSPSGCFGKRQEAATLSHGLARATEPAATALPGSAIGAGSERPQRAAQDREEIKAWRTSGCIDKTLWQGLTTAAAMVGGVALGRSDELPAIDIHKLRSHAGRAGIKARGRLTGDQSLP